MNSLVVALLIYNIVAKTVDSELIMLGGTCAEEAQFPYIVQVKSSTDSCGGAIISSNYIITAKHCVDDPLSGSITIRAGSNYLNIGGEVYTAADIKFHPEKDKDLALVRLDRDLNYNSTIRPIEISNKEVPENAKVVVAGWGFTAFEGPPSFCLKFNTAKALSTESCAKLYPKYKGLLCLVNEINNGACFGDSGGPAIYNDQLVGVAIRVFKGCGIGNPDGYARISLDYDWIKQNSL